MPSYMAGQFYQKINPKGLNMMPVWTLVLQCSSLHLNLAIPSAYTQMPINLQVKLAMQTSL